MVEYLSKGNKTLDAYGFPDKSEPVKEISIGELKRMKKKVEKTIKIDDGYHKGIITNIEYRTEPFEYVDIHIKETETDIELKCGVPFNITENTALGQMLQRFGATLEVDKEIEVEDFIKKDVKVEFLTRTDKTDRGNFARIVSDTLKPLK